MRKSISIVITATFLLTVGYLAGTLNRPIAWASQMKDRLTEDNSVQQVEKAMSVIAQTEWPHDIDKLLNHWGEGHSVEEWATYIVNTSRENRIDPLLLTAIVWQESKFKVRSLGDHHKGKARSCGPTQVRVDFPGRPTCEQLLDPEFALGWTARFVASFADKCKGRICLKRYNGGGYEVKIWRNVDLMRRGIL